MNIDIWVLLWLQSDLSNHLKGQLGPPVSDVAFLLLISVGAPSDITFFQQLVSLGPIIPSYLSGGKVPSK